MRCTLPRPFTSCSLEPLVPSSPCWPSTSRWLSQTFSKSQFRPFQGLGMDAAQCGFLIGVRPIIEYLATPFWHGISDRCLLKSHCEIHKYKYKYTNTNKDLQIQIMIYKYKCKYKLWSTFPHHFGMASLASVFVHSFSIHSFIRTHLFIHSLIFHSFIQTHSLMSFCCSDFKLGRC